MEIFPSASAQDASGALQLKSEQQVGSDTLVDFDAFLNLFVSQLRYQDPLNPVANEDFLAQTAQFSSVEQLVALNRGMEAMANQSAMAGWSTGAALIGRSVSARVLDADGNELEAAGRVTEVATSREHGMVLQLEDGTAVPLSAVVTVSEV